MAHFKACINKSDIPEGVKDMKLSDTNQLVFSIQNGSETSMSSLQAGG